MAGHATRYVSDAISLDVFLPPPSLAPYISTFYRTEVFAGNVVEDRLPPESGNLRTGTAEVYEAGFGDGPFRAVPRSIISGPTDRATKLRIGQGTFWGVGLTPAGWRRFVAMPASDFTNQFEDTDVHGSLDAISRLFDTLAGLADDTDAAVRSIGDTFEGLLGERPETESTIHAVHHALTSENSGSVARLASMAGMNMRTFERFCNRHFGFAPSILLRRRRFLRSLAKFMLDPSMRWINTLDPHYHDQAHFIREFRAFMGMNPSQYANMPHPVVGAAVAARSAISVEAMQALHAPPPFASEQTGL